MSERTPKKINNLRYTVLSYKCLKTLKVKGSHLWKIYKGLGLKAKSQRPSWGNSNHLCLSGIQNVFQHDLPFFDIRCTFCVSQSFCRSGFSRFTCSECQSCSGRLQSFVSKIRKPRISRYSNPLCRTTVVNGQFPGPLISGNIGDNFQVSEKINNGTTVISDIEYRYSSMFSTT